MRLRSVLKKLLLASIATVLALAASEGLCRLLAKPMVGHGRFFTSNGLEVPLGEIIAFVTRMGEADARQNVTVTKPYGMMLANLKMRMGYDQPRPRWDYFDENGCIAVDTNSLGLRDLEFSAKKAPGEFRVLALGDSMTYGQGVRLDLTWPQVLESRLRAEWKGPVEVINAGFAAGPGVHSPDGYDRWVADNGILFEPDIVVVGVCLNDLGPVPMLTYPAVQVLPVWGGYSVLLDRVVQYVQQRHFRSQQVDYLAKVKAEPAAWAGTQRGLLALRDTLKARNVPLVVCVFPMLSQLEPELYPCRPLHALVMDFCAQNEIRAVDLLPTFLGMDEGDLWVHASDQHGNHVVHRMQAEAIQAALREMGLLPKPR